MLLFLSNKDQYLNIPLFSVSTYSHNEFFFAHDFLPSTLKKMDVYIEEFEVCLGRKLVWFLNLFVLFRGNSKEGWRVVFFPETQRKKGMGRVWGIAVKGGMAFFRVFRIDGAFLNDWRWRRRTRSVGSGRLLYVVRIWNLLVLLMGW